MNDPDEQSSSPATPRQSEPAPCERGTLPSLPPRSDGLEAKVLISEPVEIDLLVPVASLDERQLIAYVDEHAEERRYANGSIRQRLHRKKSLAIGKMEPLMVAALAGLVASAAMLLFLILRSLGKI